MSQNSADPLFGGLIPRRVERESPIQQETVNPPRPSIPQQNPGVPQPIVPRLGINRLAGRTPGYEEHSDHPGNAYFQQSGDTLLSSGRARANALFDSYSAPQITAAEIMGGHQNNQQLPGSAPTNDQVKTDLEHRKQALEEWKAHNPNGQIKTDKTGRIILINPVTGKTTDTGIKSGDMSDEEKRKHKLEDDKALIEERAKQQRITENTKPIRDKDSERPISASQQRIAEDDSARELLNDPRYSFLKDNGIISFDNSGGLNIDNAKAASSKWKDKGVEKNATEHVKLFREELKAKAAERTNKTLTVNDNKKAPAAPEGWEYVRSKENDRWVAVEKKK